MKMYSLTIRNRASLVLFTVFILGIGAVLVTVGFALLLALAAAAGVLGAGFAVVRMLRGGRSPSRQQIHGHPNQADPGLDPALEVKPVRAAIISPADADRGT